jgi:hypothetical protein
MREAAMVMRMTSSEWGGRVPAERVLQRSDIGRRIRCAPVMKIGDTRAALKLLLERREGKNDGLQNLRWSR